MSAEETKPEFTGNDVNYYLVDIKDPKRLAPYTAECEDIIEALGMTFSEGCEFKALWRSCAARTLGKLKKGMDDAGIYDAEKQVYYAKRTLAVRKRQKEARLEANNNVKIQIFGEFPKIWPCENVFKGQVCKYTGAAETCDKSLDTCINLGNEKHFSSPIVVRKDKKVP